MLVMLKTIKLQTKPQQFYDITSEVERIVKDSAVKNGISVVFSPGSTCGIMLNENDPMLFEDMKKTLGDISSDSRKLYQHAENAYSHIRSVLIGSSKTIPVEKSELCLGEWQSILFCEFDTRPRSREVFIKIISE